MPLALSTASFVTSPVPSTSSAAASSLTAAVCICSAMNAPVEPAAAPPGVATPCVSKWCSGATTPRTTSRTSSSVLFSPHLDADATATKAALALGARRPSANGGSLSALSISRHDEGANGAGLPSAVAWNVASGTRARRHAASSSRLSAAARCASRDRYTTSAGIAFALCGWFRELEAWTGGVGRSPRAARSASCRRICSLCQSCGFSGSRRRPRAGASREVGGSLERGGPRSGGPPRSGGASGRRHAFPPPSPRRENTEPRGSAPRSSRGLNAAGGFSRLGESGMGRLAHAGSNGGSSSSSSSAQPMLESGGNALSSSSAPQSCFAGCASAAPAASSSAAIGTGVRIDQALRTNVCARRFFESGRGVGGAHELRVDPTRLTKRTCAALADRCSSR